MAYKVFNRPNKTMIELSTSVGEQSTQGEKLGTRNGVPTKLTPKAHFYAFGVRQ
jgi:hypothetical protein